MADNIFLIHDNDQLTEMFEQPYDSESRLQELLAKYPNLLAGSQIDSISPRQWLLISREFALPSEENGADRWSVDHLFLDQDAIPTLVEVKRSSDTRIRREVVGQMLDYAANTILYLQIEKLRTKFVETCTAKGINPEEKLMIFLGSEADPEMFWQKAKENLEAGKIRLLFVADKIPSELRRIVEFLNEQMDPAEILAVEIKQYVGPNVKTLVPRLIGQTAKAEREKSSREAKQWDEKAFLQSLTEHSGPKEAEVARKILEWSRSKMLRIDWGRGSTRGMFQPLLEHEGHVHHTVSIWTHGKIQIEFVYMETPFDKEQKRQELRERLNTIQGVSIPNNKINAEPPIPLVVFKDETRLNQLLETLNWLIEEIRAS